MRTALLIALILIGWNHLASGQERRIIAGKDVDGWVAILRNPASSSRDQEQAIRVIGEFGAEAKAAVPFLIERFVKAGCEYHTGMGAIGFDPSVKKALVQIGEPSVPALLEVLNGPDASMRVCAAEALGEIGPLAHDAVPRLIQAVERPEPGEHGATLRRHAIDALGKIGPDAKAAVPLLMDLLGQDGDSADLDLVVALDRLGSPPSAKLVDLFLRDADAFVERNDESTSAGLCYLGLKARSEAPRIRALLADNRPTLRVEAAAILAHIDPANTAALPVLIKALDHSFEEEGFRSYRLFETLVWLGPTAKAAMPGLIVWARKAPDTENLYRALVAIDPDNSACVPLLIEGLKEHDHMADYEATVCLGLLGSRARSALPALVELIRNRAGKRTTDDNPVWSLLESAIRAVGRIDPRSPEVISALIQVIEGATAVGKTPLPEPDFAHFDKDPTEAAAKVLGSIGPAAKAAVPALIDRLRTNIDRDTCIEAVLEALGKIGPEAKAALPVLREMADNKDKTSLTLLVTLHQIDVNNKGWLERLEKLLARSLKPQTSTMQLLGLSYRTKILGDLGRSSVETDRFVRNRVQWMKKMFPEPGDPRNDAPSEMLEDWIERFGSYGVAGREAIPWLSECRLHRDPWIRLAATEALRQIRPTPPTR
jgi:HEAT repeat protein